VYLLSTGRLRVALLWAREVTSEPAGALIVQSRIPPCHVVPLRVAPPVEAGCCMVVFGSFVFICFTLGEWCRFLMQPT